MKLEMSFKKNVVRRFEILETFSNPLRRDPPAALTCESGLSLVAAAKNFSHPHGTAKNAKNLGCTPRNQKKIGQDFIRNS